MKKLTNEDIRKIKEINGTKENKKEYYEAIGEMVGGEYNNCKGGISGKNNEIHFEDGVKLYITVRKKKITCIDLFNEDFTESYNRYKF